MFELSGKEFKITMINMLKGLMVKVNNIHEQMGNFNRDGDCKIKSNFSSHFN